MREEKLIEHPSFGKVTVSRVSGNDLKLFGSEVKHRACVSLTVETAKLQQNIHGDHVFGKKHVVEFWMSEAQWAHMLSSFGDGSGTPVTLRWTQDTGYIQAPPDVPTVVDVQRQAVDNEVKALSDKMKALEDRFTEMLKQPTVKKRDIEAMRHELQILGSHFRSNLPYYEQATIERMEKEVSKARIEIDALVNGYVHRAGLEAIANGTVSEPLKLQGAE